MTFSPQEMATDISHKLNIVSGVYGTICPQASGEVFLVALSPKKRAPRKAKRWEHFELINSKASVCSEKEPSWK